MQLIKTNKRILSLLAFPSRLCAFVAILFVLCIQPVFADTHLIRNLDVMDTTTRHSASHWIEQGNLQSGRKMYGETAITITSLPQELRGTDWIQTAYGSGAFHEAIMATFQLTADAEVYIAHNRSITEKPSWLTAYHRTGLTLLNSAGETFDFFVKQFHQGDTVRLGNNSTLDTAMYIVAVKPVGKVPAFTKPRDKVFDVAQYDAKGDDATVNTKAIQSAIDDCTAKGGGTVYMHDGIFVTGSLELKDNVTLYIEAGSILRGSADHNDYLPKRCALPSYRGLEDYQLLYAEKRKNIGITGGGIIDGFSHGKEWPWKNEAQKIITRPRLIRMVECRNIHIQNISLIRTAYWTQYYEACDSLVIDNERVRVFTGQDNADGIDISGCKNVELSNYYAITGDDAVCIKSMSASTTEHLYIHDIIVRRANCHAVKIGTETHSDIKHVLVRNVIASARYGTAVESVDGSTVEDIVYDGITLTDCAAPIFVRLGQRGRIYEGGPKAPPASAMRNITLRNIRNTGISYVANRDGPGVGSSVSGIPGQEIENLLIENCDFLYYGSRTDTSLVNREVPENIRGYPEFNLLGVSPAYGLYTRHIKGVTYRNINIKCLHPDTRPAILMDDVTHYTLTKISCDSSGITVPSPIYHRQKGQLSPSFASDTTK